MNILGYFLDSLLIMNDATENLNESMIQCTKTGELQSLKTLLKRTY